MSNHYQIEVEQQPVELYKLLKIANLVSGGGEAKMLISQGYVLLNGEIETQKRKKVFNADIIEFNGDIVELICLNEAVTIKKSAKEKKAKPDQHAKSHINSDKSKGKRRAINFS